MRALLLAAGLGSRLRPITNTVPKCLVTVLGRPLLDYWLELLFLGSVSRVLINTHYLPQPVRDFVAASPYYAKIDLVHEEQLLGTAGTVLKNRDYFGRDSFIVAHADNLTLFNVGSFIKSHERRPAGTVMTMMTFVTDTPSSCGIVHCDAAGIVKTFHEKVPNPPGNVANAAVYIFEPDVIDFIEALGKPVVDLSTEVIPFYLGRIATFHNARYHRDIGTPESLQFAEREMAELSTE